MKSLRFAAMFVLIGLPSVSAALEDSFYESIQTLDSLFMVIHEDTPGTGFSEQGMAFTHYYSKELNRSFITNDERGEVCHTYTGEDIRSCFFDPEATQAEGHRH